MDELTGVKPMTVTLAGATGLIGGHLLNCLLQDDAFDRIFVPVRRPVAFNHPKLRVMQVDFSKPEMLKEAIGSSHAVFVAVGTTQKKVKGDKDAYRKVDFDIPVSVAKICAETGCPQLLLVSSVGADAASRNFYLQLKGAAEDAVGGLGIPSVAVFRPSMLLGQRNEFRLGEKIGQFLMKPLTFLFPSDYKPVQALDVAKAMVRAAKKPVPGVKVYHYRDMKG